MLVSPGQAAAAAEATPHFIAIARLALVCIKGCCCPPSSLEAEVGGRGSLAAGYSAHKKAQSRPGFGLLRASVLTSNREEKQLVL